MLYLRSGAVALLFPWFSVLSWCSGLKLPCLFLLHAEHHLFKYLTSSLLANSRQRVKSASHYVQIEPILTYSWRSQKQQRATRRRCTSMRTSSTSDGTSATLGSILRTLFSRVKPRLFPLSPLLFSTPGCLFFFSQGLCTVLFFLSAAIFLL